VVSVTLLHFTGMVQVGSLSQEQKNVTMLVQSHYQ
jgi:hypothetical protein